MKESILILSPHTDDETLGCGGVIQSSIVSGRDVHVGLFSHGGAGIKWSEGGYKEYSNAIRLGEFYKALEVLGVSGDNVHLFCEGADVIHHKMDTIPIGSVVSFIEKCIVQVKPTAMFVPFAGYDQDHMAVNQASKVVMRPHFFSGSVFEYAVGSETEFVPNTFFRMSTELIERKVQAFACYNTQKTPDHHLLSSAQIRNLACRWGAFSSTSNAEAFIAKRVIL